MMYNEFIFSSGTHQIQLHLPHKFTCIYKSCAGHMTKKYAIDSIIDVLVACVITIKKPWQWKRLWIIEFVVVVVAAAAVAPAPAAAAVASVATVAAAACANEWVDSRWFETYWYSCEITVLSPLHEVYDCLCNPRDLVAYLQLYCLTIGDVLEITSRKWNF